MEEQFLDEKILYISPAIQASITENSHSEAARLLAALTDKNGYKVQDYVDAPERQSEPGYVGCISVGMRGEAIEISEPNKIVPILRNILADIDLESTWKIQKKILAISRAVQVLINDTPQAAALLERLKKEQGYEVQDIVDYGTDKPGVLRHIVTTNTETANDYVINSADGIVQVLSKILSSDKNNAVEYSPAASPAPSYQDGGGRPNALLMNGDPDPNSLLRSSSSARWCSWFTRCCPGDDEQNPLLSSEIVSKTQVQVQKK